ncbi:MFS transporter [Glycomyces niveus]|uniref:MFS transporter n=1 Tax=Glycomyces niveus TaxID=2820287 RepID=A0ABS3U1I2_9ACTN|nr:MFS transporter [Glycomyces sp. NEAU-S30]MBO3732627.1 MFS transporter [Glycomyces sp. NEAU-S30]
MMHSTAATGGVLSAAHRSRTVGVTLTVSLVAFESLGIATVLPGIARDIGGLGSYGWGLAALMLASLIGTVLAGRSCDRRGPHRPLLVGLAVFALGCGIAGSATSWPLFLLGRCAQGLGTGALMAMAYTVIGLTYPERLRARMFALLSSAWTVPSLVGPVVAAALASAAGWQWVFVLMLPLIVLAGALTLPGLRRLDGRADDAARTPRWRGPAAASAALAAGTALLLFGLQLRHPAAAFLCVATGAVVAVAAVRVVTPAGTLTARRGVASGVIVRFLLCAVYFGSEAFLPLGLTELRGTGELEAGLGLSAGALAWVAGSVLQARWDTGRVRATVVGFGVLAAGLAIMAFGVLAGPGIVAVLGWAVGGMGMGIAFNAATTETVSQTPAAGQGEVNAALQLAQTLATAVVSGLGGAIVAHSGPVPQAFLTTFLVTGLLAVLGLVLAPRLRASGGGSVQAG